MKPDLKATPTTNIKIEDLYGGQLLDIACNICQLCLKEVRTKSAVHLKLFSVLFPQFVSVKLLQVLLEKRTENTQTFNELCEECLSTIVNPLLVEFGEETKDLSCVMGVLFGVLSCYTLDQQIETLNQVIEVGLVRL